MELDTLFLKRFDIMDYSLFVVVEQRTSNVRNKTRNEFFSEDATEIYHIGIIDYL